jgi:hypothetical protein
MFAEGGNNLQLNSILQPDYEIIFLLILTRLCVWVKALFPDFPYCALDLLISAEGFIKWSNAMKSRPLLIWSAP